MGRRCTHRFFDFLQSAQAGVNLVATPRFLLLSLSLSLPVSSGTTGLSSTTTSSAGPLSPSFLSSPVAALSASSSSAGPSSALSLSLSLSLSLLLLLEEEKDAASRARSFRCNSMHSGHSLVCWLSQPWVRGLPQSLHLVSLVSPSAIVSFEKKYKGESG
ncbi:hypothetical protein VTN02DRAFT_6392 [Thermoascus thermophilus]